MDSNKFEYALYKLVAIKLKTRELSQELKNQVVKLYNSINPAVFKGQRLSEVLPVLSNVIAKKLQSREGLKNKFGQTVNPVKTNKFGQTVNPVKTNKFGQAVNPVKTNKFGQAVKTTNKFGQAVDSVAPVQDSAQLQPQTNKYDANTKTDIMRKSYPDNRIKPKANQPRPRVPRPQPQPQSQPQPQPQPQSDKWTKSDARSQISQMLKKKSVKDRRRIILQLVKEEKEFDTKSGLNFDDDLEKLDLILANSELNLNKKVRTVNKLVERNISTKERLIEMIGSAGETENDRYMSANFYDRDEPQELTKFETKQIQINKFLGINDISTLQLLFNPSSLYVRYYVVLDTDFRIKDNDTPEGITQFQWNYSSTRNLQPGFCNSVGEIRDVTSIRMYQPKVHNLVAMNTTAKRVSILIEEFAAQSFIGENGRRFHFTLRPNFSASGFTPMIELTMEDNNDTVFNFRKPFTTIDKLTVSFGEPLELLVFPLVFNRFFLAMEFTCLKSDR